MVSSSSAELVSTTVPYGANSCRWYVLWYLHECDYPASITELSEYIGSRVERSPDQLKATLQKRDLPALATCDAITYDPHTQLACLKTDQDRFTTYVRQAIRAGTLTHLKPPKLSFSPHLGSCRSSDEKR